MYPKNASWPPALFARVVNAATGAGITSGVSGYHIQKDGTRTATSNAPAHVSGGLWRLTPVQAESNYNEFAIEFYHADAVGGGPVVSIVTTTHVAQSGDTFAELPTRFSNLYVDDTALGGVNVAYLNGNAVTHATSGYLKTDAVRISGSQAAADNVEANIGHLDASIAGLNDPSAAAIADAVWDESTTGHVDAGTFGQQVKTDIDAILADTSELQGNQSNWTTATGFSTHTAAAVWSVASRVLTANTNLNDPSAAAIADAVLRESVDDHKATAASLAEHIDAIHADTNDLQANQSNWATATTVDLNADQSGVTVGTVNAATLANGAHGGASASIALSDYADFHASGFSTHSATDVWAATTRTLTAFDYTVDANLTQIEGHSLVGTGTQIADAFEYFFNVGTPSKTINDSGAGLSAEDVWTYMDRQLTGSANLNDPTAASIADAVWDEARSGHVDAGSFGETLGTVETNIDNLDASIAGLNNLSAADVNAQADIALSDAGVTSVRMGYVDNLNGHTAQTGDTFAELPTNFSDLYITAIDGRIDVGSWLGTAVTTSSTTSKPEVDMASISDNATAASSLEAMCNASPVGTVDDATPTTTSFATDLAEASNGHYNGAFLLFTGGALLGQSREIASYDGTSKTVQLVEGFTESPADGTPFVILGRAT